MCRPDIPNPKTIMPAAPALPEKAPKELAVKKNKSRTAKRNPLRIDLATKNAPGVGVNV